MYYPTDKDIKHIRDEAVAANDSLTADLADKALHGDIDARMLCWEYFSSEIEKEKVFLLAA